MSDGKNIKPIPNSELLEDFYENLHRAYRSMRTMFALRSQSGTTQDEIAARLSIDKGLVSKRLRGLENMTLKTMSYMASALSCRLQVVFEPYEEILGNNYYYGSSNSRPPTVINSPQPISNQTQAVP